MIRTKYIYSVVESNCKKERENGKKGNNITKGYFMNHVLKRIDRIWIIIKIGEKKENEFVYLDFILK